MNIVKEEKSFSLSFNDGGMIRKGEEGKSAYEVALEQGFEGSEEEWLLSLKGEQGEEGSAGPQGEAGVSPVISVSEIYGGHRIDITDVNGRQSVEVMDGVDGMDAEGAFALSDCAVPIVISVESHGEEEEQVIRTVDGSTRPLLSFSLRGGCNITGMSHPDDHSKILRYGESGSISVTVAGESETKSFDIPITEGLASTRDEGIYDEIRLNEDGTGTLIRRCGFKVYDGTEKLFHRPNYNISRFEVYGVDDSYPNGKESISLCSHYEYAPGNIEDYQQRMNSSASVWAVQDPRYTDAESYKAYLASEYAAGTPVTLCYRLETPREETLTVEQVAALKEILLYRGQNRITNSEQAVMTISYTADTQCYIDAKIAELKEYFELQE